jgi:hypothetical protein
MRTLFSGCFSPYAFKKGMAVSALKGRPLFFAGNTFFSTVGLGVSTTVFLLLFDVVVELQDSIMLAKTIENSRTKGLFMVV